MGHRGLETRNSKRSQPSSLSSTAAAPPQLQQQQQQQSHQFVSHLKKDHSPVISPHSIGGGSITPNSQPTTPITVGALEVQNVKRAINRYGTLPKGARIGAYLESLRQTNSGDSESPPPHIAATAAAPPPQAPASVVRAASAVTTAAAAAAAGKTQPQMIRSNSSGGVTMSNSASASLNKLQRHRTTTDGTMMTTFSSFRGTSGSPKRAINPSLADLEFPPPPLDLPPPAEEFETQDLIELLPPPIRQDVTPAAATILLMSQSILGGGGGAVATPSNDVSNTEPSVEEASSRFGVSLRKREPSTDSCSSMGSPADDKLDIKLATEINARIPPRSSGGDNALKSVDPAAQLVNELADAMNLPKQQSAAAVTLPPPPPPPIAATANSFKTQLKKVEPKKILHTAAKEEHASAIIDFKSRLRKVENNNENDASAANDGDNQLLLLQQHHRKVSTAADADQSKLSSDSGIGDEDRPPRKSQKNGGDVMMKQFKKTEAPDQPPPPPGTLKSVDGDDDKRKSTGSISSLKKLWEAKEGGGVGTTEQLLQQQQQPLSPKMMLKNATNNKTIVDEENEDERVGSSKKPAVPIKPTKLVSIYATPIQVKLPPQSVDLTTTTTTTEISRDGILELVVVLEGSLKIPLTSVSAAQWLQLSDKLNILHGSCVAFADKESMPPHSKFQFREVVTRVEGQSRCLRSAGSKNSQDNEKLMLEVGQSLKQISNALHR